ncbi:hypothetical protein ACIGXF_30755 [Streptomyces sp. NPDC053086]|uniref:hypothetical protein n=1 Tax=unclassified Streptomyces TaxID=2593676 RepID=UPI0037D32688
MPWEEWNRLVTDAKDRGSTKTQLNHLADPGGGGSSTYGDLKVGNADLVRIGKEAHSLHDQLRTKARVAQSATESAAADLAKQDFRLGKALKHVARRWDEQLTSLQDACAQISHHMHVTQKIHGGDDGHIGRAMSSIDTLDAGFDDRVGEPGDKNPVYYPKKER